MQTTTPIGFDIAKSVFQIHRVKGEVLLPKTALIDRPALVQWVYAAASVAAQLCFAEVNSTFF